MNYNELNLKTKSRAKLGKNERLVMIYVAIFTIVAFALFVGWAGNEVIKI